MTDCTVRSRIDSHMKTKATNLFSKMGLTLSEAIRIFLYQAVAEKQIPFTIGIPNQKTKETLEKANKNLEIESTSMEKLKKLGNK